MRTPARNVLEVSYQPAGFGLPFEALRLSEVVTRVGRHELTRPQRIDFDLVIVCTAGRGSHEADFERVDLWPRRAIHLRPGQVMTWAPGEWSAHLLLFEDAAPLRGLPRSATAFELSPAELDEVEALVTAARRATGAARSRRALLAWQTLLIDALALDRRRRDADHHQSELLRAFTQAIELDGSRSRSVSRYARSLGCSPRTLSRACESGAGMGAKELLDERVGLEARRMLVAQDRTIASVALELGFSQPSNFTKFFRRVVGEAPQRWRARGE